MRVRCTRLLAAVGRLRELTGMAVIAYSRAGSFEQSVTAVRSRLSDEAFVAAWSAGEEMRLEEAVAFALDEMA